MSTYKRSSGNIVFETTTANKSVSFIGPTANAISVVINGDLSVSGNASLTGNIAGDKIFNGTSSIEIPVASGNANISIGGTSNVLVVATNGITVSGNANVSGNAVIGNLQVNGVIAGNVTFGNLDTAGNVSITRDASLGQPTFKFNDTDTTISINTVIGAVEWYTSDLSPGGRVTTAVRSIATSDTGNARFEVLTSTGGAAASAKFVVDNVGNVGVANTAPLHTFAVSGNTFASGTATVIGDITGGNLITAGLVSATGNVTSAANIAGGNLSATGNVTANNLTASSRITAGAAGISATGNITGGNLISQGIISATGNLTTTDVFATTLSASGNITGANLNLGGVANASTVTASSTISATGNITGGNVNTAGRVSATANIVGGNIVTPGIVSSAGNIVAGAYFLGDGGFLSNVTAAANSVATKIQSGTTEIGISTPNGNIVATVGGTSNVIVVSTDTFVMTGAITASGNVTGGNINTAGVISATGNINGGNVNATFGNFNTVIGAANASNLTTGTVPSDRLSGSYVINITGFAGTVSSPSQPNITSVGNLSSLTVVGNTTSGNLSTGGLLTATGNITGGNLITSGLVTATGNINTSGGVLATGNITGGNVLTGGIVSSTGNITGGNVNTARVVASSFVSATGNITGGNVNSGGLVSATGNLNTSGNVSATGNVTGAFILGNITFATGFNASKIFNGTSEANIGTSDGNANITIGGTSNVVVVASTGVIVTGTMSASGNVTGGNLITGGVASVAGNIAGGNVNTGGLISATGAVVGGSISTAGNVTGGNINTGGLVSATGAVNGASLNVSTGNITGGNLLISGAIIDSAQLDIQTSAANANIVLTPNGTGNVNIGRMSASGNITAVAFYGNGASLSSITGANVTGTVANATFATSAGSATSATTAGTVTTAAQPNITSVGTLSSLAVTANITAGNLSVSTGNINAGNIVNSNANGVGNIGSATTYFNTVFARATSALYADLAEKFLADQHYLPGTVLIFGGEKEVTISTTDADHRVAGVVSTDPSYLMNSGLTGNYVVELALQGRVPCKVFGPVEKGDLIVSAHNGHARGVKNAPAGTIIGKSLVNFDGESGVIEIVVGRD